MLEEERAQDGRAYNQEDTRAEPACGGLRGVGVAGAEFAVHLDASDKPDYRADGVDEFRAGVKVGSDHAGGFGDARLPVSLCVGTYHGGKYSRRQEDFLSHCDLFLMPGGGWIVRLSRLVNNLKF